MFSGQAALQRVRGKSIIVYILSKTHKIIFSDHIALRRVRGKPIVVYKLNKTHKIFFLTMQLCGGFEVSQLLYIFLAKPIK